MTRRQVLRGGMLGIGLCAVGVSSLACGGKGPNRRVSNLPNVGPLGVPDANGLRLPAGFSSRVVARSGEVPPGGLEYVWHQAPAGGAAFATEDGGWIYVSNSELGARRGGTGALRFGADAQVVAAYSILAGTTRNAGGGPTPWGTWLSCEANPNGQVWECDPNGIAVPLARPALGVFRHEAAAVDPSRDEIYMTEAEVDGRFYRYVPPDDAGAEIPDLENGRLEVARVVDDSGEGAIEWLRVPDPSAASGVPTRDQVRDSTPFRGGGGIWFGYGVMYFSTKVDNRIWAYDVEARTIEIVYDEEMAGVGDLTVSAQGDVLIADDGAMQLIALVPTGEIVPVLQVVGQDRSELTGPAFDPSGTRLYFSSQRDPDNPPTGGITYEVTGPFFR